jgi:hypothetical protein
MEPRNTGGLFGDLIEGFILAFIVMAFTVMIFLGAVIYKNFF